VKGELFGAGLVLVGALHVGAEPLDGWFVEGGVDAEFDGEGDEGDGEGEVEDLAELSFGEDEPLMILLQLQMIILYMYVYIDWKVTTLETVRTLVLQLHVISGFVLGPFELGPQALIEPSEAVFYASGYRFIDKRLTPLFRVFHHSDLL